jgi:RNA polymerase sigma factor (sigma-70 family)
MNGVLPTTRPSIVAGIRSGDAAVRARSLDAIVRVYWRAVYKHLRTRWRASPEDAKDLTQAFFSVALEKDYLATFDPEKGSFRGFLRVCADRFAANHQRDGRRQKRGGGARDVSLDFDAAEGELARQLPASPDSIDRLFYDEWCRALLAAAIEALRLDLEATGRGDWFRLFERYELRDADDRVTYADLARELGVPVTTVTNRLAVARRELRRHALEQLAELTASEEELREEARALFGVDAP